jgi:hypothetical protein
MERILVTGAGGSAASNFVASLRMAPEPFYIVGADVKPYHLELADVERRYLLPPASDGTYIQKLNELIAREHIDLVHAQPDPEVAVLSESREAVGAKLYLPSPGTVALSQNKMALIERLRAAGLTTARSYLISSPDELQKSLDELLPGSSKIWLRAVRGAGSRAALPIRKFDQGRAWIEYWLDTRGVGWGDFMASEYLPGAEFAFQSLWRDGELITSQARQRLEYLFGHLTASGQTSTPSIARTVHSKEVNEAAIRAVQALDPHATGVFCVDLKQNVEGLPCVTEINAGRFFTTSNFFATAGSNMPYYYVKMAFGKELPPLPRVNAVPENWYWVRNVDMGYKLVRGEAWTSSPL